MSAIAYCAGVIDSDGTIGIKRSTYAMRVRGDAGAPIFSARICVRQVERGAVDLLASVFGGNVRPARTYAKRGRPMWQWEARDRRAEAALKLLMPHLRIKRAQARNCLALRKLIAASKVARCAPGRGHAGGAPRPAALTEKMEACYAVAHHLNQVGQC